MHCIGEDKALHKNSHKDELPLYLSSTQILSRFPPNVKVSATQIGKAMKDLGYNQVRANNVRFGVLSERTGFDITHALRQSGIILLPRLPSTFINFYGEKN